MAKGNSSEDKRTRLWAIVVYPESAPENWRDILDELHIEWVESPLHEFDVNPTGEVKKAHWHVLLSFHGPKSYEQVVDMVSPLNCPIPQRCHSAKGTVRYMAHLDNPDKFQYSVSQIIAHGGADLGELLSPTSSERYSVIRQMCEYVRDSNITEFQDLMDYAMAERYDTWFPLLCDNSAYIVGQYIKSQRHRQYSSAGCVSPQSGGAENTGAGM